METKEGQPEGQGEGLDRLEKLRKAKEALEVAVNKARLLTMAEQAKATRTRKNLSSKVPILPDRPWRTPLPWGGGRSELPPPEKTEVKPWRRKKP